MGARPVALLDGLRFGEPGGHCSSAPWRESPTMATASASPTVGGETVFDPSYADNCLVNAMCVGLLPTERVLKAQATRHRATSSSSTARRPGATASAARACSPARSLAKRTRTSGRRSRSATRSRGKKLIESSLELVERDLVESLQDCGAAGLASSLAEMAGGGGGIDVHLDRVPLREEEMEPWEIMISESQERMVAVVRPENLAAVEEVCDRWELAHARDRRGDRDRASCAPTSTASSSARSPPPT